MMSMIEKEIADEKVHEGYLRVWLMFEALAVTEDVTKKSLESLIERLDKDERVKIYKKDFSNPIKVDKPLKDIETGYSLTTEIELISKNFDDLVQIVTEYGPSAIELLEPKQLKMDCGEAQAVLNTISQMMHQFAAAGVGGIVLVQGK